MKAKHEPDFWAAICEKLKQAGVDLQHLAGDVGEDLKVVCIAADLGDSVRELGKSSRDQVVMVRVDDDTLEQLDAWVEAGAVRSRSEAAALFIREGLAIRRDELRELSDALRDVRSARDRLKRKAREIFGKDARVDAEETS